MTVMYDSLLLGLQKASLRGKKQQAAELEGHVVMIGQGVCTLQKGDAAAACFRHSHNQLMC